MRTIAGRRSWRCAICMVLTTAAFVSCSLICSGAPLPIPTARTLMLIAFPDWNPMPPRGPYASPHSVDRYLHLSRRELFSVILPGTVTFKTKYKFEVSPLMAAAFDDSHAILLTSGSVDPDSLGDRCDYSCVYATGAYFFTADAHGWRLSKSIPVVSLDSASAFPHDAKITKWPGHDLVASFRLNDSAQGYSTDDIYLLELTSNEVIPLFHTSIAEDNSAASGLSDTIPCGDDAFSPKFVPPHGASLSPDVTCYESDGSWRPRGNTIVFEFHGVTRSTDSNGRLLPLKSWQKTAVLALQRDGSLKLISGTLPK
jgi:hypothetical protein